MVSILISKQVLLLPTMIIIKLTIIIINNNSNNIATMITRTIRMRIVIMIKYNINNNSNNNNNINTSATNSQNANWYIWHSWRDDWDKANCCVMLYIHVAEVVVVGKADSGVDCDGGGDNINDKREKESDRNRPKVRDWSGKK